MKTDRIVLASCGNIIEEHFGRDITVSASVPVAGGDINRAYRLTLSNGLSVFLKTNTRENLSFFIAESECLLSIARTESIGTPKVFGCGEDPLYGAFLLLEWCDGLQSRNFFDNFGHSLAAMHKAETSAFLDEGKFGFFSDNYIGSTPQKNTPFSGWVSFFRDCRLIPQFRRARHYFSSSDHRDIESFLNRMDSLLPEPDFPSLLHGDLWGGNYIAGNDGEVCLIDPASYVGHFEADLAMTELFGGFPSRFYAAYQESNPISKEYSERRDIYNLYHLLNHLNLFGEGYLYSVLKIIRRYS